MGQVDGAAFATLGVRDMPIDSSGPRSADKHATPRNTPLFREPKTLAEILAMLQNDGPANGPGNDPGDGLDNARHDNGHDKDDNDNGPGNRHYHISVSPQ